MSERLLDELAAGLEEHGVRGAAARRVLAEAQDHLDESARAGADSARTFGDPREVARLVAAELATTGTRRAVLATFSALAVAGVGYALALSLVRSAGGWQDVTGGRLGAAGPLLALALVLLPQIAFVAGCLGLVGALRLGSSRVVRDAELRLLRRRSAVALGAGGGTVLALAAFAFDSSRELAAWWVWATLGACALSLVPLAGAAVAVARARRPAAEPGGSVTDVFDDLGPVFRWAPIRRLDLPEHPWRFALLCAGCILVLGTLGGWYAEGDPGSGLVRGGFEAVALLICFAALGRTLGLRRSNG